MYKRIYREKFKSFDKRKLIFNSTNKTYIIPNYSLNSINIELPHYISLHKIILNSERNLPNKLKIVINNNVIDEFSLNFIENNIIDLTLIFPDGFPIFNPVKIFFDNDFNPYNQINLEIKYISFDQTLITRYLEIHRPYSLPNISFTQFGQNLHYCLNNNFIIEKVYNKLNDNIIIRDNNYRIITQSYNKLIIIEEDVYKIINNLPKYIEINDRNNNNTPIIFIKEYYCYNNDNIYIKKPVENTIDNILENNDYIEEINTINNQLCPIEQTTILNNTEIIICSICNSAFKKDGLKKWLQRGNINCPICRNNILNSRTYLFINN